MRIYLTAYFNTLKNEKINFIPFLAAVVLQHMRALQASICFLLPQFGKAMLCSMSNLI